MFLESIHNPTDCSSANTRLINAMASHLQLFMSPVLQKELCRWPQLKQMRGCVGLRVHLHGSVCKVGACVMHNTLYSITAWYCRPATKGQLGHTILLITPNVHFVRVASKWNPVPNSHETEMASSQVHAMQ